MTPINLFPKATPSYRGYLLSSYQDLKDYYSLSPQQLLAELRLFEQARTQNVATHPDSMARNLLLLWSYGNAQTKQTLEQQILKELL